MDSANELGEGTSNRAEVLQIKTELINQIDQQVTNHQHNVPVNGQQSVHNNWQQQTQPQVPPVMWQPQLQPQQQQPQQQQQGSNLKRPRFSIHNPFERSNRLTELMAEKKLVLDSINKCNQILGHQLNPKEALILYFSEQVRKSYEDIDRINKIIDDLY